MRTSAIYCAGLAGLFVLTTGVGVIHAEEAGHESSGRVDRTYAAVWENGPLVSETDDEVAPPDEVISDRAAYGLALAREIEQAFRGRDRDRMADTPAAEEIVTDQSSRLFNGIENSIFSGANFFRPSREEQLIQRLLFGPDQYETGYKSMVFRFGSGWDVSGEHTLNRLDFRSAPVYEVDLALEPAIVTVEYQYELLQGKWGLGASKSCLFDTLSCQWRATFHLDGGKMLDTGDNAGVANDVEFLQAGLNLSFTFQPTISPLERYESQISTYYFEDLVGNGQTGDLSEKTVFWRVDDDGELRLRARYRHGDLPLIQDKLMIVTLGLEVKF